MFCPGIEYMIFMSFLIQNEVYHFSTRVCSPNLAHISCTKSYAKGKLTLKVTLVPYGNGFFLHILLLAVFSLVFFFFFLKKMKEKQKTNNKKGQPKKKKKPTMYRFVTAKI